MLTTLLASLTALALTIGTPTQAKTDFSGRWTTDPDPAAAPAAGPARGGGPARGDMGSGWGSPLTVTQDGSRLTIEYAFFGRGDMQPPLKFIYALDGSETKNTVMMGRGMQTTSSRTAWDGARLKITTLHTLADPATGKPIAAEVVQTLSLESPTSLVVETTRAGVLGAKPSTTKTTYRKL